MRGINQSVARSIAAGLGTGTGGGGSREINAVCPAITPTIGAEMWDANASTFEGSSTYGWAKSGNNTIANDGNSLKITYVDNAAGAYESLRDALDLTANPTVNAWYQLMIDTKVGAGNSVNVNIADGVYTNVIRAETATDFHTTLATFQSHHATNGNIAMSAMSAGEAIWVDNLSLKPVTNTDVLVGTAPRQAGAYTCKPIVADNTQAGLKILYKDANNYVQVIVNRAGTDKIHVYTMTAGTWAAVTNCIGNIVYGDGKQLKALVTPEGAITIYYDDVPIGTAGALTLANFGLNVYGFSTYASNAVGEVTSDPNFL